MSQQPITGDAGSPRRPRTMGYAAPRRVGRGVQEAQRRGEGVGDAR